MNTYDSMLDFLNSIGNSTITGEIQTAFIKAWPKIHGYGGDGSDVKPFTMYPKIMVSVSGGADSDIVIDMIERIGYPLSTVHYVFYDTGLEFQATKEHLNFLEEKYSTAAKKYEPNLYRAALHVFSKSYEYTRKYREYREQREKEQKYENH